MATLQCTLNLNWETEHDTAKGLMIHTFTNGLKVISSIKSGLVRVFKGNVLVNTCSASGWKVSDYTQFLSELAVAEAVETQLTSSN